jgi:NOL1/NOP2/fmu family ribosome biogenesis protein
LGIELGSFKGSDFLPSHSLAMNQLVSRHLPSIAMNKEEALRFLKKEPLHFGEQAMGWKLATYNGQILGWVKVLKDRTNNYLPMDRKIRMNL